MSYLLRNEVGKMISKIPNNISNYIIKNSKGYFIKKFKINKDHPLVCFVITEEQKLKDPHSEITLYLWKGYILEPSDL